MALKPCKECGKMVAELASKCPHCGNAHPSVDARAKAVITTLVLAVIGGMIGWCAIMNIRGRLRITCHRKTYPNRSRRFKPNAGTPRPEIKGESASHQDGYYEWDYDRWKDQDAYTSIGMNESTGAKRQVWREWPRVRNLPEPRPVRRSRRED